MASEAGTTRTQIRTRLWHAEELGAAELLRGRFAGFDYDLHTHDTACLALITHGAIRIRLKGGELVARAGDLFAIDAGEPHAGWAIDAAGWSQRTIYVGTERLQALLGDTLRPPAGAAALAGPIIRDATLARAFRGVHRCSEIAGPRLKREERFLQFATRLFARHVRAPAALAAPGRETAAVARARDFLDERLDAQVHLGEIAAAAGLPPFQLLRAFVRETGMSPHAYQRQARIRLAARLIRRGEALGEVAAAAGFADQAHLTRRFRRALGVTPGAYRAACGNPTRTPRCHPSG